MEKENENNKRQGDKAMKRYIHSSVDYSKIPTEYEYFAEVDDRDMPVFEYLKPIKTFNGRIFAVPSARNQLGRTNNYSKEDKCIQLDSSDADSRTYLIPYTEYDRNVGDYRIYTYSLTCFDDGSFKFGSDGKIRRPGDVKESTLSNDVYKARGGTFYY